MTRNHVVHVELHTSNLSRACAFYARLFDWQPEPVRLGAARYLTLPLGDRIEGGVVERETDPPLWLPYVEVADVPEATERAQLLGASVLLTPREGPVGWRSVLAAPAGGKIALWQPKSQRARYLRPGGAGA